MGAVENAGQRVVIVVRNRIEFMIVAAGATEGEAQERLAHRVDLVIDHVADHLLLVSVVSVPGTVYQEACRDATRRIGRLSRRIWEQIAGDLMHDELVEWQVVVE
jgi:hypothetical protein